jgi:hypothetical protein
MVDLNLLELKALAKNSLVDIKQLQDTATYLDEKTKHLLESMTIKHKYMLEVIARMVE